MSKKSHKHIHFVQCGPLGVNLWQIFHVLNYCQIFVWKHDWQRVHTKLYIFSRFRGANYPFLPLFKISSKSKRPLLFVLRVGWGWVGGEGEALERRRHLLGKKKIILDRMPLLSLKVGNYLRLCPRILYYMTKLKQLIQAWMIVQP